MSARPPRTYDPFRPQSFLVERERADSGEIVSVATLFLTNRQCPWRCVYCDLWKGTTSAPVPVGAIPAQIDFALLQPDIAESRHIKLYNAGSFFDPKAISPSDWPAIAQRVSRFERVIVECHPALVNERMAEFLARLRAENPNAQFEVAMGLEIADDEILRRLEKRMTLAMFAGAAGLLRKSGVALRAFVMVQPPFSGGEPMALVHAERSVRFAFDCGATVVSLIPSRTTDGLSAAVASAEFTPPNLRTVELAFANSLNSSRGRVFVDLWDLERFASCPACFSVRRERLARMNLEQNVLPDVLCGRCESSVANAV